MDTSSDERIVENLRLEDLPEIIASRVDDDEEMEDSPEPERSMEEILQELVTNILNRTSTTAVKAMKEVEQHVSSGMYIEELLECADQLVENIRLHHASELPFLEATPVQLVNLLLCRCEEERVNLKKAAICALQSLFLRLHDPSIVNACVDVLVRKCRDLAVAVRKQAALTLTRILQESPTNFERIHEKWLHAVLHQIVDREQSVQAHCAKLVAEVLIDPIVRETDNVQHICWKLLVPIEEQSDLHRLLLRVLHFLHKEKCLPKRLSTALLNRASATQSLASPCWMMLSLLSTIIEISPSEAVNYWSDYLVLDHPNRMIKYLAELIAHRAEKLSFQQRRFLKDNVGAALQQFKIHPTYLPPVYYLFAKLMNAIRQEGPVASADMSGQAELTKFNQHWFGQCVHELDTMVYVNAPAEEDDNGMSSQPTVSTELPGSQCDHYEKLFRLLTCIGECIQYTPALINKTIFNLLQVIISSDVLKQVYQSHSDKGTGPASTPRNFSPNTSFNTELPAEGGGSQHSNAPSVAATNHIQMRIRKRIFRSELMSREVRANAVLTMGKLCLLDEQLAKKCIPVFVRQLRENSDHFVRNNIVVVVCDLCIRYTSQVDRYSTILASCLWDSSLLIRHQTLMLLTNLIKEQYLKWEGPIIYRFVTTLLDPEPSIQEYANFCLTDILLAQFKERMFFHHFLECMFNFNGVRHASWMELDGFELSQVVDNCCSLKHRDKFEARMRLYKYMLNTFEDQQKIYILEKIGLEIFVPIVEGGMKLHDVNVRNLLYDAFKVMSAQEIKLKLQLGKRDADYEGDEEEPPELVKAAAKKFIATTFRKSIAETVMPHLFSIKAFLTEKRSPLSKNCYSVIINFCREHEEQLDDFLASDPQLKAEIKFDIKRLKEGRAK